MLGPNFEVHLLKTNDVSENVFIIKVDFIISYGFIDRTASEMTGDRMGGGRHTAKGPRSVLEPGAAAARTKPLHMALLLHQHS